MSEINNEQVLEIQKLFLKAKTIEQIKYLQEQGFDLHIEDRDGYDVLSKASTVKQTAMFLEAGGFSQDAIDNALIEAKNVEQTKLLTAQNPSEEAKQEAFQVAQTVEQTELLFNPEFSQEVKDEALNNAEEIKQIEFLLGKGISQNGLDDALDDRCSYEKAKLLVKAGAKPIEEDGDYSAFQNATTPEYMELLLKAFKGNKRKLFNNCSSLRQAVRTAKSVDLVDFCLKHGANPNKLLHTVQTAAETEFLLQNGANVNATRNHEDENALWGANLEKTRVLLKYGIDVNHKNEYGKNVLYSLQDDEMERGRLIMNAGVKDLPNVRITDNCQWKIRQMFIDEIERREHIQSVRDKVAKMHEDGVSGVVIADKVADKMRENKEKGIEEIMTPKHIREDLAPKMRAEIKNRRTINKE